MQKLFSTSARSCWVILGCVAMLMLPACGGGGSDDSTSPEGGGASTGDAKQTQGMPSDANPQATGRDSADAPGRPNRPKPVVLLVTSSAFENLAPIPREYTCDGADTSPPLSWTSGPAGTRSYALIVEDPDAPGGMFTHWVIWNIANPQLDDVILPETKLGSGAMQGTNSWTRLGYGGPCPPDGEHQYIFTVYALDTTLTLPATTRSGDLRTAMDGHVLGQGTLIGTYVRDE
jgi:Raf kinase inhibitor-like YbhB/YbcL family protein